MSRILIGLCGYAGAGKNAVAEHLVVAHGFDVMAFAEPVYAGVAAALGMEVEDLERRDTKELPIDWLGMSPRALLQTFGTEWGRDMINPDIWVLVAERRLAELQKRGGGERVVFTDTRFANEALWLQQSGGVLWEIYGRRAADVRMHESEAGIPSSFPRRSIWNGGEWADTVLQIDQALATDTAAKKIWGPRSSAW